MKANKTVTLDIEVIAWLSQKENASRFFNDLCREHMKIEEVSSEEVRIKTDYTNSISATYNVPEALVEKAVKMIKAGKDLGKVRLSLRDAFPQKENPLIDRRDADGNKITYYPNLTWKDIQEVVHEVNNAIQM